MELDLTFVVRFRAFHSMDFRRPLWQAASTFLEERIPQDAPCDIL